MKRTMTRRGFMAGAAVCAAGVASADAGEGARSGRPLRAGAAAVNITPTKFPVLVNGGFAERRAARAHDRLHARALVLADERIRIAIAVVDSCLMPAALLDEAKAVASKATGIPRENILIAATHTHSAPAATGALGCPADADYAEFLPGRIAEAVRQAAGRLEPAGVGHAVVAAPQYTNCRRWILRPDKVRTDPFGERTVRAMMHPGYVNPAFVGPAGPIDPDLSVLAVRSKAGRPIALLANYSMHYYGAPLLSADYFGAFARNVEQALGRERRAGTEAEPAPVAMMSQGTSGDLHWMDYSRPARPCNMNAYAEALAKLACQAYETIEFSDRPVLAMRERKLTLAVRRPDEARLAWARKVIAEIEAGKKHGTYQRVYSREQIHLHKRPMRELKLQAVRIGGLGLVAMPCEVYGITGLKIKARSPLTPTVNFELANGAAGYIPPPEQHALGGYTTWEARSACLEVGAEPKIVEAVLGLLEAVSGRPWRAIEPPRSEYAKAVLASKPAAYWPMADIEAPAALDAAGRGNDAAYECGVALYLPGPVAPGFARGLAIHRAVHFAGGRMAAKLKGLGEAYTAELWFWNGLPADVRAVTGYFFSRGRDGADGAPGDHLGIGGTRDKQMTGKLLFYNGDALADALAGTTQIRPRTWYFVALVRKGEDVTVYLNGSPKPEISGRAARAPGAAGSEAFIGGRSDGFANFEGKISDVAVYGRAMPSDEIAAHYTAAMGSCSSD